MPKNNIARLVLPSTVDGEATYNEATCRLSIARSVIQHLINHIEGDDIDVPYPQIDVHFLATLNSALYLLRDSEDMLGKLIVTGLKLRAIPS